MAKLAHGIPAVGLGVWKIANDQCANAVYECLKMGYRHIDSACDYGNEKEVGEGIARAIKEGICTREDLWVTSKLWNTYHRPEHVEAAFRRSLNDLGLEYMDLYLIHFPISLKFVPFEKRYPPGWTFDPDSSDPKMEMESVSTRETWEAMEALVAGGCCRNIGVANFNCQHLRDLLSYAKIRPICNQVELHPYLQQEKLLRFCNENKIPLVGFSPLGALSYQELGMATATDSVLEESVVKEIAAKHGRSPGQIVLRWAVQRGTGVIPKSSNPERQKANLSLFDFELSAEEMGKMKLLDKHRRFNDPGVFCEAAFNTFCPIFD